MVIHHFAEWFGQADTYRKTWSLSFFWMFTARPLLRHSTSPHSQEIRTLKILNFKSIEQCRKMTIHAWWNIKSDHIKNSLKIQNLKIKIVKYFFDLNISDVRNNKMFFPFFFLSSFDLNFCLLPPQYFNNFVWNIFSVWFSHINEFFFLFSSFFHS